MLESALLKAVDMMMTNGADAVTAVSRYVEADLLRHGARPDRVRVIPNGIDLTSFDRRSLQTPETVRRSADELLIGCVGSLHARKGHRYVVRAMPAVLAHFPRARLVLWGEGAERSNLEHLGETLGVRDSIDFAGFSDNVPAGLRQIDLFIQPSLQEAFGIVILEAMAVAKPVIGSRTGGIAEVIDDGVPGRVVPPEDAGAIAEAACALLGNAELRNEMGLSGRARVSQCFDIQKTVSSNELLYSELTRSSD
jgi:glycosyltransferase involved in cell wall biosynthesis